jgi:hypothetical protein
MEAYLQVIDSNSKTRRLVFMISGDRAKAGYESFGK